MMTIKDLIILIVLLSTLGLGSKVNAQVATSIGELKGMSYKLEVDDISLHYEIFGEGDPLLILHGNGGSTKGKHHMVPELAKDYQVILMDSRCHGQSSCSDETLDYFQMAEDVFAMMDELGHEKYTIWGHSDGGILSLILGYTHTDRINRLVVSGANARLEGLKPELIQMMENYEQIPNKQMSRHVGLMMNQKPISMDDLTKVDVPVLIIVGDRDAVLMDHTMEIFRALPKSNLCVLPGSSHFVDHEKPGQIIYWIKEFSKDFKAPSTVEIAKKMAEAIYSDN